MGPIAAWADVDFSKGAVNVTGGERGTKNSEHRTVPMTGALRGRLQRLPDTAQPKSTDRISSIDSAKKCLGTACRCLSYPRLTHHDHRHFCCVESDGFGEPMWRRRARDWFSNASGLGLRIFFT